ncbi:MAG TPA: bluetail domain-containing putative surface protein [Rhizomicrobium sp.]|jgi:hypothetical protein|nr:bluetail domain-containing putative surface protein [Rhizomicrobium sp.]
MAVIKWNVNADGDWETKQNWDLGRAPKPADKVTIDTADLHTVTINDDAAIQKITVGNDNLRITGAANFSIAGEGTFSNSLILDGGNLLLAGMVHVSGLLDAVSLNNIIGAGTLTAAGGMDNASSLFLNGEGTLVLQSASTCDANSIVNASDGYIVENQGTLTLQDRATISLTGDTSSGPHGILINRAGASLVINNNTSEATIINGYPGDSAQFVNYGNIQFNGPVIGKIDTYLQNFGSIDVQSGTLSFASSVITSADNLSVSDGATLAISSRALPATITGGKSHGQGTIALTNTIDVTGKTTIAGDVYFSGAMTTHGNVFRVNGMFTNGFAGLSAGSNLVTAGGAAISGSVLLSGESRMVLASDTHTSVDGRFVVVSGSTLENQGHLDADITHGLFSLGYNPLNGSNNGDGTLENDSGARITLNYASSMVAIASGSGHTAIDNFGLIESIGTGNVKINVERFDNQGTVHVVQGSLTVNGTLTGGSVVVEKDASFVLNASDTLEATDLHIDGKGTVDLNGGAGFDTFWFARPFSAADHVDGGDGSDSLMFNGIAGKKLVLDTDTVSSVEYMQFQAGRDYKLVATDGTVAAGQNLYVNASPLEATDSLNFNGSAEHDGTFMFSGGAGNDTLKGGTGADFFDASFGADSLYANGNDTFAYLYATESMGVAYDTVHGVDFAIDRFDVTPDVEAIDPRISGANLSKGSLDADLSAVLTAGTFGSHHAILIGATSGNLAGHLFLIVDYNGVAGYQAGQDLVVDVTGAKHLGALGTALV